MLTKNQLVNLLSELKINSKTNQRVSQYSINVEFKRAGFSHFTYIIKDRGKLPHLSTSNKNSINRYINEVISAASGAVKSKAARALSETEKAEE